MTASLLVMLGLACLATLLGLLALVEPAAVRRRLALQDTPQMAYILRIVGTMLAALGLILFVFAATYWRATLQAQGTA